METSVKRSDTGHRGVREGWRSTVRKHLQELESLWVVTKGECVLLWIFCVCV